MRTSTVVALLTVAIVIGGCGKEMAESSPAARDPGAATAGGSTNTRADAEADFLAAFEAAVKTKNIDTAMALVDVAGLDAKQLAATTESMAGVFELADPSYSFVAKPADFTDEVTLRGTVYRFNLEVVKQLRVEDETGGMLLPVGMKDGKFYIANRVAIGGAAAVKD